MSKFTADSLQEELSGDLGEEFYGVSSEIIRKIFEPLYKALPKSGSTSEVHRLDKACLIMIPLVRRIRGVKHRDGS